ncbi:HNH endonuclease [Albimonas pacifica]|uniref:HNH endonuclease n=1 Tax=Albimonas pacifica TaxID=1114924 RepID=A0A1I3QF92_9RHOB|nr:HNH endonuclease [Albimonas pacifica]SFJ32834.1 HNH endonuclease [Albimonas pacifica]
MRRWLEYSAEELEWISARREMPRRELHAAFCAHFERTDVSADHLKALCTRKGWKTGRTGCFAPGSTPANKGRKMPFNANSARTQFKKGSVPPNAKPLGHERVNVYGYVEISVAETNPYTGGSRRYVTKHKLLWERANGPLPEGMRLKCLDGDKLNTDPSNWLAIPTALAPRLNGRFGRGYDAAPAELKPVIMATAQLEHAARERRKGGRDAGAAPRRVAARRQKVEAPESPSRTGAPQAEPSSALHRRVISELRRPEFDLPTDKIDLLVSEHWRTACTAARRQRALTRQPLHRCVAVELSRLARRRDGAGAAISKSALNGR